MAEKWPRVTKTFETKGNKVMCRASSRLACGHTIHAQGAHEDGTLAQVRALNSLTRKRDSHERKCN